MATGHHCHLTVISITICPALNNHPRWRHNPLQPQRDIWKATQCRWGRPAESVLECHLLCEITRWLSCCSVLLPLLLLLLLLVLLLVLHRHGDWLTKTVIIVSQWLRLTTHVFVCQQYGKIGVSELFYVYIYYFQWLTIRVSIDSDSRKSIKIDRIDFRCV